LSDIRHLHKPLCPCRRLIQLAVECCESVLVVVCSGRRRIYLEKNAPVMTMAMTMISYQSSRSRVGRFVKMLVIAMHGR